MTHANNFVIELVMKLLLTHGPPLTLGLVKKLAGLLRGKARSNNELGPMRAGMPLWEGRCKMPKPLGALANGPPTRETFARHVTTLWLDGARQAG